MKEKHTLIMVCLCKALAKRTNNRNYNLSYPSWIFTSKTRVLSCAFADETSGLTEAGSPIEAAVGHAMRSLQFTVSSLITWIETLTLVARSAGRVLRARGSVPARIFFASRHLQRTSRSGKTGRTKAERSVVLVFSGRSGQTDSGVLADGRVAGLSIRQRRPIVTWNKIQIQYLVQRNFYLFFTIFLLNVLQS
jgi:hypothetical protein